MKFRVVFTASAERDLNELADYICDHQTIKQALYVVGQIRRQVETLRSFPSRGEVPPELADIGVTDFRQLHWKPYRIIYTVEARCVTILLIADGRRDMKSLLARRLFSDA